MTLEVSFRNGPKKSSSKGRVRDVRTVLYRSKIGSARHESRPEDGLDGSGGGKGHFRGD